MARCIHELEAPVTKRAKDAKKKKGETAEVAYRSITDLKEAEKMMIRPLPMYIESLIEYYLNTDKGRARQEQETIGDQIAMLLTTEIPATEAAVASAPLPYCRVCDVVCTNLDGFYEHLLSADHKKTKMTDSVPLFVEDETLTRNQVIAREFLGPSLLVEDKECVTCDESTTSSHSFHTMLSISDSFEANININVLPSLPPSPVATSPPAASPARSDDALAHRCPCGPPTSPRAGSTPGPPARCECQSETSLQMRDDVIRQVMDEVQRTGRVAEGEIVAGGKRCQITQASSNVTVVNMDFCGGGEKREKKQHSRAIPVQKKAKEVEKIRKKEEPSGRISRERKAEVEERAEGDEEAEKKEQSSDGIPKENEETKNEEGVSKQKIEKERSLTGAILSSLTPQDIMEYRLKKRPCAECARIWDEYGALIATASDMSIEFAFRSHPLHPAVTLLSIVLECFKPNLVLESDESQRPIPSRPVKFPSNQQLKEVAQALESVVTVPIHIGDRHSFACVECFQVAMHSRVDEVKAIYESFMETCRKRDTEGRLFFCDICRLVLPSSRHFRLHLLSEAHDKKTGKAPLRQSDLYNPLCQMVCFIDAVTLLQRKKLKKIETKEEKKKERKHKKEEHTSSSAKAKKEEGDVKMEMKEEKKKKRRTRRQEDSLLVVVDESEDSPWVKDKRGFLVYRMGHPKALAAQKKEIKVIRRERTASEQAADEIVYVI